MNAFASYGDTAAPIRAAPRGKPKKEPSALDLKMAEKQRLTRAYKASLRKDRLEAFTQEPRLFDFMRYLRRVRPNDADELVEAVQTSWLPASPQNVRILALRLINRHCDRLNRAIGNEALDDPLPPEKSVYFHCRDLLHAGGMA